LEALAASGLHSIAFHEYRAHRSHRHVAFVVSAPRRFVEALAASGQHRIVIDGGVANGVPHSRRITETLTASGIALVASPSPR